MLEYSWQKSTSLVCLLQLRCCNLRHLRELRAVLNVAWLQRPIVTAPRRNSSAWGRSGPQNQQASPNSDIQARSCTCPNKEIWLSSYSLSVPISSHSRFFCIRKIAERLSLSSGHHVQVFAVGCRCAKLPNPGWVNSDRSCEDLWYVDYSI